MDFSNSHMILYCHNNRFANLCDGLLDNIYFLVFHSSLQCCIIQLIELPPSSYDGSETNIFIDRAAASGMFSI